MRYKGEMQDLMGQVCADFTIRSMTSGPVVRISFKVNKEAKIRK